MSTAGRHPRDNGASGKCNKCKRPTRKGPLCRKCLELKNQKNAKRARKLSEAGKCVRCARRIEVVNSIFAYRINSDLEFLVCPLCFFKTVAEHNLKQTRRWKELQELFEKQARRCAYTAEELVIGRNASLDHKIPRSRGGTNDLDNLQWVSRDVNLAKHDLTHQEFIALCHKVLGIPYGSANDHR